MKYPKDGGEEMEQYDDDGIIRVGMEDKCVWWDNCCSAECPCIDKTTPIAKDQTTLEEFFSLED